MTREVYGIKIPENLSWSMSFRKWIEQWNAATDATTAIGLLHNIFRANDGEVRRGYDDHRILFLLTLADGHRMNDRSGLAGKAFSVLAHEFFRNPDRERTRYLSREVIDALFTFFLDAENGAFNFQWNVRWEDADSPQSSSVTHADQLAAAFLRYFCSFVWDMPDDTRRIRVVELLAKRDKLHTLVPSTNGRGWDRFTEPVMQKLEEAAMKCESTYGFETDTPTLEELIYHGSPAAKVLLLVRAGRQGQEKEKRRRELKEQAAQAAAGLAQLHT